jgi:hypothetical protein
VKSFVLSFVTTAAIVLSPVAFAAPVNAASATSSHVSISASVHPYSYGKLICSSNGIMCLQRITSIDDSGTAYVDFWADTVTWAGWFALYRNGNFIKNSPNKTWVAGGVSWLPSPLAAGGGWSVRAMQNPSSPRQIAEISFGI